MNCKSGICILLIALATGSVGAEPLKSQAAYPGTELGSSSFFTTTDGVELHYLEAGQGRVILFVPGWTMPADIWEYQIRELSKRYRVVALDPRSQGRSAIVTWGHWHPRRAADIQELILHLDLSNVALVGWSMAVPEVLTYVDRFDTDRIGAVILVDGMIWVPGGVEQGARFVDSWGKQIERDRQAFAERFVRGMYTQPHPDAYISRVVNAHMRTPNSVATTLLANASIGSESDKRNALSKIDRPLLYVITSGLMSQADTVKARLPAARIEVFEGMGHALFVDAPDRFNELLDAFLTGG